MGLDIWKNDFYVTGAVRDFVSFFICLQTGVVVWNDHLDVAVFKLHLGVFYHLTVRIAVPCFPGAVTGFDRVNNRKRTG